MNDQKYIPEVVERTYLRPLGFRYATLLVSNPQIAQVNILDTEYDPKSKLGTIKFLVRTINSSVDRVVLISDPFTGHFRVMANPTGDKGKEAFLKMEILNLRRQVESLEGDLDALSELCPHEIKNRDGSAYCWICDQDIGVYCGMSPTKVCEYVAEGCKHCGKSEKDE